MVKELFTLKEKERIDTVDQLWGVLDDALGEKQKGNTQIVAAMTPFTNPGELKRSLITWGFSIKGEWGNLLHVTKEREVPFYAFLTDPVVLFITLARKTEDIPGTILNYLRSADDVVLIRMGSRRMRMIRNTLADRFPGIRLSYFTAHREPHSSIPSACRKESQRTIIYSGADGFDTLEEMEYQYGIVSRIMEFHYDGTVYGKLGIRFDVNGIFTITDGPSLIARFIVDGLITEQKTMCIDAVNAWKETDGVASGSGPISGVLGQRWNRDTIERMRENLASEWDITGFLSVTNIRNEYHYSRIVDVIDGSVWDLILNGDGFSLTPVRGAGLRSFMKIVDVVDDHLGLVMEGQRTDIAALLGEEEGFE